MINHIEITNTFDQWRIISNLIIDAIGNDNSTLTTADKSTLINAINELDSDITALVNKDILTDTALSNINSTLSTNTTNIGSIQTTITGIQGDITSLQDAQVITSNIEYINHEPNHGRLSADNDSSITVGGFDNTNTRLQSHNTSVITAGDKFINDNANNGGAAGTMGADAVALLTAMTTPTRLNGFEFHIMNVVAGSGTTDQITVNSITYNPIFKTPIEFISQISNKITYGYWLQVKTVTNIIIGNPSLVTYINGVVHDYQTPINDTNGWIHIRHTLTLTKEYEDLFPAIYANDTNNIQIALPTYIKADVNFGIHKGII